MFYYVYTDHAQYTIKTYAKMALFPLLLTGPLSREIIRENRTVSFILTVDLSMRAECMHENKNEVTGNLLLGCTVLRITREFPGAVTI